MHTRYQQSEDAGPMVRSDTATHPSRKAREGWGTHGMVVPAEGRVESYPSKDEGWGAREA